MEEQHNISETAEYRDFWQNNLQKVEEIAGDLKKMLLRLEKKHLDFEALYDEISNKLDLLSSIYSGFNNILGMDYVLKLKALLNEYRHRYIHEGTNFSVIYYIHSKVMELRDKSFENFPEMNHVSIAQAEGQSMFRGSEGKSPISILDAPHKWITFQRNNSWFIAPYDTVDIIDRKDALIEYRGDNDRSIIRHEGSIIEVIDPLVSATRLKEPPSIYIIIKFAGQRTCRASSGIGKRILSRKDVIRKNIRPIPNAGKRYGQIRMFGKRHIYMA